MDTQRLAGKSVIVTGASAGIGKAIAVMFGRNGARLVLAGRDEGRLQETVDEIVEAGGVAFGVTGDVRDEAFAQTLVEEACAAYGGLHGAVNNAGTLGPLKPTPDLSTEEWQETINTNLTSAFYGAKHQVPALLASGEGFLIFVSSFVGYTAAMPQTAAYAASKAGVIGLMKSLAVEFGAHGLRVNALLPGGTQTAMADIMAATDAEREFVCNMHALKRMAHPDEQAEAALFLASEAASFVTGSAFLADGGVSISKT